VAPAVFNEIQSFEHLKAGIIISKLTTSYK